MTDQSDTQPLDIVPITIEEEMRRSYLDYAMSVIVARALPDVRDGLKPVHRRILYAMNEGGYTSDKPYRKSARIVGDVMGKYHPHGDSPIYEAMVRMAQPFSMRLMLLDGQGNFGSMDGDRAAAMRYTETRLAKSAEAMLDDIDKDTVDFQPNYDESEKEPQVLPARFPNLLVNGASGIAVGMATNIPPHNLGEVVDACLALMDHPGLSIEDLNQIVLGPDFPTGALILGRTGIRSAMQTGRGSIVMRGRTHIEELRREREAIIITEIPFQVNKASMIEKIGEAVKAKKIEGIAELRDESNRDGVRVVVELKRDAVADVVLNQLYRFSPLQQSFGVNMLALNAGRPELLNLKDLLVAFVAFREEVVTRRTRFLLAKARDRAHILAGLAIAVANLDEMINMIRTAPDPATARERLMGKAWPALEVESLIRLIDDPRHQVIDGVYRLSEAQARAILDLRLQRLTALGRDEIANEMTTIAGEIKGYLEILGSRDVLQGVVRAELTDVRNRFATPRRTEITDSDFDVDDEDLIQREDMVVTVSHAGYVKRTLLSTYRPQRRGGKGRAGMSTRDEDFVTEMFVASTHAPVLFFSNLGRVYKMKVYRLPLGNPQSRGKALINLLPLADGEKITTLMPLPEDESLVAERTIVFATAKGNVRRNALSDFVNVMANGKIAMKFEGEDADDALIGVVPTTVHDDVLLSTRQGQCLRFAITDDNLRIFRGRDSTGVRGIRLSEGDSVVSVSVLRHVEASPEEREAYLGYASAQRRISEGESGVEIPSSLSQERMAELQGAEQFVLTVTANGFGKRTSAYEYRVTGRGGSGIINIQTTERNGGVAASFTVDDADQIMLVTNGGQVIRCPVDDIRVAGRNTQGVTLFKTAQSEEVVSVARLPEASTGGDDAAGEEGIEDSNGPDGDEEA